MTGSYSNFTAFTNSLLASARVALLAGFYTTRIMADRNSYLQYKRDTKFLIFWLIRTSNAIIKSSPDLCSGHGMFHRFIASMSGKLITALISRVEQHWSTCNFRYRIGVETHCRAWGSSLFDDFSPIPGILSQR
jgi:hypothetical protein